MKSLYKKIYDLQKDIEPIKKSEENPFYHSSYFDINTLISVIQPLLNKHGLIIIQPLSNVDAKPSITTVISDVDTGETIESKMMLPDIQDPQKMGAAITYFRRYAIQSLLLLEAEDDDGNSAVEIKKSVSKPPVASQKTSDEEFWAGMNSQEQKDVSGGTKDCVGCGKEYTPKPGTEKFSTMCASCYFKSRK